MKPAIANYAAGPPLTNYMGTKLQTDPPVAQKRLVRHSFAPEKRRIAAWLSKHAMTLADVGVDHPARVLELDDPDVIQSLIDDIEEEKRENEISAERQK